MAEIHGHIGAISNGFCYMHGRYGLGDRNVGGASLLDFVEIFVLVIADSCFLKKENHIVTIRSTVAKIKIKYLFFLVINAFVRIKRLFRMRILL